MNESTDMIVIETFEKILGIIQDQTKASEDIVGACNLIRLTLEDIVGRVTRLEKKFKQWELLGVADENIN